MKQVRVNTTPYPVKLNVCLDVDAFVKAYQKLKGCDPDLTDTNGITTYSGNVALIGIFTGDIVTLVHELNHFCLWTFDYIGMPVNSANSEAYCYYYDYLLNQVLTSKAWDQ